jgi:hypothetical protein
MLGTFEIPLNRIDRQCPRDGSPLIVQEQVSSTSLLTKGEIEIEVRRFHVPRDYIERKQQYLAEKLPVQINNINRFNTDNSCSMKLTANIQVQGNMSLLHAAVQMRRDDLVEKLVELGANPNGKSKVGTPLRQALNLRDRAYEQFLSDEAETEDVALTQGHEELYKSFERIVELLRNKGCAPQVPQEYLFIEASSEQPTTHRISGSQSKHSGGKESRRSGGTSRETPGRLPDLDRDWMLPPGRKRCFGFTGPEGCRFDGQSCQFAHVQALLGDRLDNNEFFENQFPRCMEKRYVQFKHAGQWHTAGYCDESDNTYFMAERGPNSQINNLGTYLYPSEKDAAEALRRVLIVAKRLQPESMTGFSQSQRMAGVSDQTSHPTSTSSSWGGNNTTRGPSDSGIDPEYLDRSCHFGCQ